MSTKLEVDFMETCDTNLNAQAAYVPSARVDVITQSQTSNDNPNSFIDNSQNWSQGFKVSTTDNITKITLYLNNNNVAETGSLIGYIYSSQTTGNGVVPYQLLATFSTLNVANLTSSYVEYDFTGTFTPTANTQYHMVFLWTGFTTPGHLINIGMSASAPYGNGNASYSSGGNFYEFDTRDLYFKLYQNLYTLQSYSESTIKTQGSYSLKAVAAATDSLNKTLTKTFASPLDLSGVNTLKLDMRATRTGSNIKLGLHNNITSNILTGGAVTTDSDYSGSYPTAYSVDGNIATRWASAVTFPHWWKYDFGSGVTKVVTKLRMYTYSSGNYDTVKNFNLQGSNDNSTWSTLYTGIGVETTSSQWQEFTFTNFTAYRYYKINFIDTWSGTVTEISIWEIELMESYLQSYSESIIKTQGSYSLKVVAAATDSLNKTLTKTF